MFDKDAKLSQQVVPGGLNSHVPNKEKRTETLSTYTKIKSKWILPLTGRGKTMKLLKENRRENCRDP